MNKVEFQHFIASIAKDLDPKRPLMGQLSSIELVEVVVAIEQKYSVQFSPLDVSEANFSSLDALYSWLESQKKP